MAGIYLNLEARELEERAEHFRMHRLHFACLLSVVILVLAVIAYQLGTHYGHLTHYSGEAHVSTKS